MEQKANFCRFCGSKIPADGQYCENCGAPIASASQLESVSSPFTTHQENPTTNIPKQDIHNLPQPVSDGAKDKRKQRAHPCLVILGVVGLILICISLIVVVVSGLRGNQILDNFTSSSPISPEMVLRQNEITITMTVTDDTPIEGTDPPTLNNSYMPLVMTHSEEKGAESNPYPSVELTSVVTSPVQEPSEATFFDDFSTTEFDWAQSSTEIAAYDYSDGQYFIHVKQPSYISWAEVPVEFTPNQIEFDAITPTDNSGGSFGVMCHIQDETNYYSIEIDLFNAVFSISIIRNDKLIPLTTPEWLNLKTEGNTNHFRVDCFTNKIRLYVNGKRTGVATFESVKPFPNLGRMALFVATWKSAGNEGYRIFFDNVLANLIQ